MEATIHKFGIQMLSCLLVSWFEIVTRKNLNCNSIFFFRRGNCKNVTLGMQCEVGLRKKTYNVLTGSVLSVWHEVESILTQDGNRKGTHSRMQVRNKRKYQSFFSVNVHFFFFKLGGTIETAEWKTYCRYSHSLICIDPYFKSLVSRFRR